MASRHDPGCSARDDPALASVGVSGLLALEIAKSGRAAQDRAGTAASHPPHEQGESALGRAPDPWRTSQTRVRIGPVDGLEVHGPRSNAARPELKDIFAQPGRWHRRDVPTLTFERLFAFGVLGHARRRLLWFAVTRQPTAEWLAQQITEAFPWDSAPAYLVRDNDGAYEKSSGVASDRWGSATDRVTGEGVNPLIRTHLSPSGRGKTPLGPHMRLPCGSPGASLSVWPLGTFQPVIR